MKSNYTHLILVLDESGSMSSLTDATIEGVNSLIDEQKAQPGDFTTAVYKFGSSVDEVKTFEKLERTNYTPKGSTALFDAVCKAIDQEGVTLNRLDEDKRPSKVVVVIVTDGQENASKEFRLVNVQDKLKVQQETYNWQVVFLGANIDAFSAGASYGIRAHSTMQYVPTQQGVLKSYAAVSSTLASYRGGSLAAMDFTQPTGDTVDSTK